MRTQSQGLLQSIKKNNIDEISAKDLQHFGFLDPDPWIWNLDSRVKILTKTSTTKILLLSKHRSSLIKKEGLSKKISQQGLSSFIKFQHKNQRKTNLKFFFKKKSINLQEIFLTWIQIDFLSVRVQILKWKLDKPRRLGKNGSRKYLLFCQTLLRLLTELTGKGGGALSYLFII